MSDRLSEIEARLQRVEEAIRTLASAQHVRLLPGDTDDSPLSLVALPARLDTTALLTLTGRTLMVLGGAYALRALTESGRLPTLTGIVLGIAYALVWLGVANRASSRQPLSGSFHGLAAILIGLPLLWEASAHFGLLSARSSAIGLTALGGVALGVAGHRRLLPLAGLTVCGSMAAMTAFIVHTNQPLPFAASLLLLGAATLWVSEWQGWWWLRWPPALAADVLLGGLIARALTPIPIDRPSLVIVLLLLLASIYAGMAAWRTLARGGPLRVFEICQVSLSLLIGLGGALAVSRAQPAPLHGALAAVTIALAAGCYVAAFGVLRRRPVAAMARAAREPPLRKHDACSPFHYYAALALALTLAGSAAATDGWPRIVFLAAIAITATGLGARFSQPLLALHGAAFSLAVTIWSGLLTVSMITWLMPGRWPSFTGIQMLALVATGACAAMPREASPVLGAGRRFPLERAARLLVTLVLCTTVGALAVRGLASTIGEAEAGLTTLVTIRTLTLAGAALMLAWLGRSSRFIEFGWFVYPVLVLGAIKLIVDDLPHSTPGALVVAFGAYGAALVLAPRIARQL